MGGTGLAAGGDAPEEDGPNIGVVACFGCCGAVAVGDCAGGVMGVVGVCGALSRSFGTKNPPSLFPSFMREPSSSGMACGSIGFDASCSAACCRAACCIKDSDILSMAIWNFIHIKLLVVFYVYKMTCRYRFLVFSSFAAYMTRSPDIMG